MSAELGLTINLSEEEKQSLESTMVKCHERLKRFALDILGNDTPNNIKKLRSITDLPVDAKSTIDTINRLAHRVIAGYIRVVGKSINYYHRMAQGKHPGLDIDDFIQEARAAIYDAMFCFDGRSRFTTFVYQCVRMRLVKFGRKQSENPSVQLEKIEIETNDPDEPDEDERKLQLAAIENADLTPLEKQIIANYMKGEKQNSFQQKTLNPKTGRPYTRQRLTMAYNRAVKKIRESHASLSRSAVA